MIAVRALATAGPREPFAPVTVERRDPGPHDVLVDVVCSGLCHTDVSHARSEWGPTTYPLVPGHEIAGVVRRTGPAVTRFAPGDRVGIGVMVDSCRVCVPCRTGREQHCTARFTRAYNWVGRDGLPTHGGYSRQIVVDEAFVLGIPDRLSLQRAAPLLCAGITVYSPMRRWGVAAGSRVGVLGLGGLGHVAVQVAAAFGAQVTVLDLVPDKGDDALALGAHAFRASGPDDDLGDLAGGLDVLVSTVPAAYDVASVLALLDVEGVLVNLGVSARPLVVDPFALLTNSRVVAGSSIGGIAQTQEMLDFCGAHDIGAWVEVLSADEVDRAYQRLDAGDVRYRFVLDVSTIPD